MFGGPDSIRLPALEDGSVYPPYRVGAVTEAIISASIAFISPSEGREPLLLAGMMR